MQAFAKLVMDKPQNAYIAAFLLGLTGPILTWLLAPIVGLAILRRGQLAAPVLLFALVGVLFGFSGVFGTWGLIFALLISVSILALVLRVSNDWNWVFLASVIISLMAMLVAQLLFSSGYESAHLTEASEQIKVMLLEFVKMFASLDQAQLKETEEAISAITLIDIIGINIVGLQASVLLMLVIARFLQASVFNPGGFKAEWHDLKPSKNLILISIGLAIGASYLGAYSAISSVLVIMGFYASGLVHALLVNVQSRRLGLWLFYITMVLALNLFLILSLLVVLLDAMFDFRSRIQQRDN